jgi:hypothetical protein
MAIIAENKGTNYEPIPAGNYVARCYSMIHIGTVTENVMGTEKQLNKVRLTFELPTETKVFKEENGEQPHVISKEFTLSMHEKATLRKMLESWRGKGFTEQEAKGFDITVLCGIPCMLNIIHKPSKDGSKTYAEISSISSMPKGLQCPPQVNPSFVLSYDAFDFEAFEKLPDFVKDKIKASSEYKNMVNPPSGLDVDKMTEEQLNAAADKLPF